MLKYYFKIFVRSLKSNLFNSVTKTLGLVIGFVSVYLIYEYVNHEISYDKNFKESESIFRVARNWQESKIYSTSTPVPMLEAMQKTFPEVVTGTRLGDIYDVIISDGKREFQEDCINAVDSNFFETFNLKLLRGNEREALNGSGKLVISQSVVKKYFGDQDPIGKTLEFEGDYFDDANKSYTITGVYDDFPVNCHLQADFLLSLSSFYMASIKETRNHQLITYVRLNSCDNKANIDAQFPKFMRELYGDRYYDYARTTYFLQPIQDIHTDTSVEYAGYETPMGNKTNIIIFPVLGLLILLIATINFINLTVAEGKYKSISFGINKLSGAGKNYFYKKFTLESVFLTLSACLIAIIIINILFDRFLLFSNRNFELQLSTNTYIAISYVVLCILLGVFNGFLASLFYAGKSATDYLKGNTQNRKKGLNISALPQIVQFSICIMLIAGSTIIFKQLNFINQETKRSLDSENTLAIKNARHLQNQKSAFKQELEKINGIQSVSICQTIPGNGWYAHYGYPVDQAVVDVHLASFSGDKDYLKTLGIKLVEGRFFDDLFNDDETIVLNQTAVKQLGWEDPIGKKYSLGRTRTVIGVVEDIHFESLHYPILAQGIVKSDIGQSGYIIIKMNTENITSTYKSVQELWKTFVPDKEMNDSFIKEEFDFWYKSERKTGILSLILSAIAIFLSSLGLLGMVLHSIQKKIKEIGVRKVNGAKIIEILALLNSDYIRWISISFIISTPIIYFLMKKWLENFEYKTDMSWWIFALSGISSLFVALIAVSWQSWRAARRNPVEALRYE